MERTNSNRKAQLQKKNDCKQVEKRKRWVIPMKAMGVTGKATYKFEKPVPRPFNILDMDPMPSTEACRDYYRDARRAVRRLANGLVGSTVDVVELAEQAMDRVLKAGIAILAQNYRKEYTLGQTPFEEIDMTLGEAQNTIDEIIQGLENGKPANYIDLDIEWPRFPRVDPLSAKHKMKIPPIPVILLDGPVFADPK